MPRPYQGNTPNVGAQFIAPALGQKDKLGVINLAPTENKKTGNRVS